MLILPRLLGHCKVIAPHHPTESNMHKFSAQPQSKGLHATAYMINKAKLACHQVRNKNHPNQTQHWAQPQIKYLSNAPSGVQASASRPPDPYWKAFPLLFSRWDVAWLCNHWAALGGAGHKTTSFLNPAGHGGGYANVYFFLKAVRMEQGLPGSNWCQNNCAESSREHLSNTTSLFTV